MSDRDSKSLDDLAAGINKVSEAHSKGAMAIDEMQRGIEKASEGVKNYTQKVEKNTEAQQINVDKTKESIEKLSEVARKALDRLDPVGAMGRKYEEERAALEKALAEAEKGQDPAKVDAYRDALTRLREEYEDNQRAATLWGKFTKEVVDDVDQVFAEAWKGAFENSEAMWEKLKAGFKQTLAEMAHEAITKPIIISFANQVLGTNTKGGISDVWGSLFGGGETIGNGGGGGSGGGFGNIIDIGKNIYSIYDTLTGVGSEIASGFMKDGLTGAFKGGINYYSTMLEGVYSKVAGLFGQQVGQTVLNATGTAAANVGYGLGQQLVSGQIGNLATAAGSSAASGAGSGFLSSLGSSLLGMLSNPATWITAGVMASWKLYNNGVKASTAGVRSSFKGANDYAQVIGKTREIETYGFQLIDKFREIENWMLHPLPSALIGGERLAAISTGSPVFQAVSQALGRLLGGGERFKTTVGSAVGSYSDGKYTGQGELVGWYDSAKRFGSDVDEALHGINEAFSSTLGDLLKMFDIEQQISTEASFRLRRTSGKLATVFAVTIDDAVMMMKGQYSKDGNVAKGLEKFFDDVMGRGLSQAIGMSDLPAYLKELTAGLKKADEVSAALGGLFLRFDGVNASLETLNLTAFGMTDAGLRAADSLLNLSAAIAGLESPNDTDKLASLGALTQAYYDSFFSETEKFDASLKAAKAQIEAVDIEFPESREAFRGMVEDIDLTTESGRQMFATMMQLAGQVDAYFDLVEQNSANALSRQMSTANSSFALVQRSISAEQQRLTAEYQAKAREMDAQAQAYAQAAQAQAAAQANNLQTMASKASERISAIGSVIGSLDQALERLRDTSEETTKQLRAQAVATVEQALAGVKAGQSVLNFPGLEEALGRASELDGNTFASLESFQREQGRTANMVAELRGLAGKQLTAEELVLQSLEAQLSVARSHASASGVYYSDARAALDREYEQAMEALQIELDEAQRQMDALNGIDNSVMNVVDAVNAMSSSVTAALKFMGTGSTPTATGENTAQLVDRMYKAIAGFAPDAGGIHFWVDQLTTGKSTYAEFIKALEGARVPAFAVGGLHTGGLRLVGENGPELEVTGPSRIYSASQTAAMLSSGATEEVRALRSDFAGMSDALRSIAKHTQQTARRVETLERWDGDGMPGERTA